MTDTAQMRPAVTPQLATTGVVAILRAPSAERFLDVATTLAGTGVTCCEVTLTTTGALDAISLLRDRLPGSVSLGAGTVTTPDEADAALDAGAEFLVSPGVDVAVIERALQRGAPCYPGAWTATEILVAWNAGATAVKLFPAATGGPDHVRHLRGPLPHIPLVPTGGVGIDDIPAYLRAGAVAVGLGGPLLGDSVTRQDDDALSALAQRARQALDAVASARSS